MINLYTHSTPHNWLWLGYHISLPVAIYTYQGFAHVATVMLHEVFGVHLESWPWRKKTDSTRDTFGSICGSEGSSTVELGRLPKRKAIAARRKSGKISKAKSKYPQGMGQSSAHTIFGVLHDGSLKLVTIYSAWRISQCLRDNWNPQGISNMSKQDCTKSPVRWFRMAQVCYFGIFGTNNRK